MSTHSYILTWKTSWTEELGELQSTESQKSQTRLSDQTTTATVVLITFVLRLNGMSLLYIFTNSTIMNHRNEIQNHTQNFGTRLNVHSKICIYCYLEICLMMSFNKQMLGSKLFCAGPGMKSDVFEGCLSVSLCVNGEREGQLLKMHCNIKLSL